MVSADFAEQWRSMQKTFLPTELFSATLRENARHFWENQEKALDALQTLSSGCFERRHVGTRSAREAAEHMCGTETFVDLVQAYQNWATGAFERAVADGMSWQQQIMAITGAFASPPLAPSATEKEVQPVRSEAKAPARSKTP